ncbi:MAG: TonB-dependent receptor [Prevotellaceae bacterium]|nr:TonB-dependent receptor [Prevotellaceae bacterium]
MRKIILFMIAFSFVQTIIAQTGSIVGTLKEKGSNMPMEYATIALHNANTQQIATGMMTDSIGQFRLNDVPADTYYIEATFVGYRPIRTDVFTLETKKTKDIGTIYIETESESIGEVVVEGRKPTFVANLDRKVFYAGQDISSKSGSVSDLLQNVPSVDVDIDGTVSLRGNENVTILINGKPSAMMNAKTRGDALNQLSAGNIERIEVITNPSAEYKPDGVSGIINIVLKKNAKAGFNGTLTGNVGSSGRNNAGVNFNYGMKGINIFGGYAYRKDRYDRTIDDKRYSATDFINQTTYGLGRPISHSFNLGMNANITENDLIEISGNYSHRRFQRNEEVKSETTGVDDSGNSDNIIKDSYLRNRDALAKENMWEGSLSYTHTYGKDNELGIDYAYSSESEDEINHYTTRDMSGESKDNESVWDANYMHIGKLHWIQHFSEKTKLTAGYNIEHLTAEQNYHISDWNGTDFIPNTDRSSDFTSVQTIHSLYSTIEASIGSWSILGGLRGEYVDIKNHLYTLGLTNCQYYANLYPTLHISRKLSQQHELQLNYSLRVNRPDGSDMNPFAEQINPLSLQAGNPNLKPEKIYSAEACWLWNDNSGMSLMTTLYYRYLTNKITEVSRYINDGVLLTTKENMNSSQNAGLELIWNMPVIANWLSLNWNVNGYYNQIDASKLGYGKNKDTFSWSTLINVNLTPIRHYMIQLNARFRSSTLVPQGRRDADSRINLGMKYDIPSLNLSILASVTDLFDTYRKSYTLDTPELKQKVVRRRNPRIFYIGLSWQFGSGKNKKHSANLEYDENL